MNRINPDVEITLDGAEAGVLFAALVTDGELTAEEAELRLLTTCRSAIAFEAGQSAVHALDRGDLNALQQTGKLPAIEKIVRWFDHAVAVLRNKLAGSLGTELN